MSAEIRRAEGCREPSDSRSNHEQIASENGQAPR